MPPGSAAVLSTPNQPTTSFTADVPGAFIVRLIVNDGFVDSDPQEVTVTARASYALTVTKSGGGSVASTDGAIDCGSICTQDYDQGTNVTLTATPDSGYGFAGWDGDCTGTEPCTVTMDAAKSVNANFVLNSYPIAVAISPANAGTAACTPNPVEHGGGSVCTVTATSPGYGFANWSGDCTGASCVLTDVTGPKSVTAQFVPLTLSIDDVSQPEGNSATKAFAFTVSLSAASPVSVAVNYATADGAATLADAQGTGTIVNDDFPTLKISDVSKREGRSGTTAFAFTVSLSAASTGVVSVNYATANGSATAGSDYTTVNGALSFNPGEKSKTITVNVTGDTIQEPNETFSVNLTGPVGAVLADAQGLGTIVNDD